MRTISAEILRDKAVESPVITSNGLKNITHEDEVGRYTLRTYSSEWHVAVKPGINWPD